MSTELIPQHQEVPPPLRAFLQVVSSSEAPPACALVVAERHHHADATEEVCKTDGRDADAGEDDVMRHGDEEEANSEWEPPGLKDLDVGFDRNFVDALCRQAGGDFFLYGAPHRAVTTPA